MTIDLYDYVCKTNAAKHEDELFPIFQESLERLGFDRVIYTLATDHESIGKKAGHGINHNYPDDWMEHYINQNYEPIDPVIHQAVVSTHPFAWDEMQNFMPYTNEQKRLINESKEAKLYCGVGLGVHANRTEMVAFGFASSEKDAELTKNSMSIIKMLAHQFHFAYTEILKDKHQLNALGNVNLNFTRKELEILHWLAEAKSNSVIASIMSISKHTVDYHLREIYKKIGSNDRVTVVVKALHYGLIKPSALRVTT